MVNFAASAAAAGALLLAGCAGYSGSDLVPGKSSAPEIEASMGPPAERLVKPDGSSVWYFPRGPRGRHTYAVTVGADGVMQAIEQRLIPENMAKLQRGKIDAREVRELLGPPLGITRAPFKPLDVWEYRWENVLGRRVLWVHFSDDGILREVYDLNDEPRGFLGRPM
ncbi:MAG: hypothetical protein HY017_33100 [Betaproteobacteria bacterium]|nr:hypothetical protein [Betaproteobacteria bacterium]